MRPISQWQEYDIQIRQNENKMTRIEVLFINSISILLFQRRRKRRKDVIANGYEEEIVYRRMVAIVKRKSHTLAAWHQNLYTLSYLPSKQYNFIKSHF